jgi:hypothetical protein
LNTYDKLVEVVADWLGRNDLAQRIPDFIRLTEADLSRDLNLREQEVVKDATLVVDQDWIQLPADLQILRQFRVNTDPARLVEIVSIDKYTQITESFQGSPHTMAATTIGDRLYITPPPTAADGYTLTYRGRLEPLSPTNSTNRILKDAPDCLLYGSLVHSAPYIGDDGRLQMWAALYSQAKSSYKRFEWRSRTSGGPLRVRPDISIDDRHNIGGS